MLKQAWGPGPLPFGLASLNDRRPIAAGDGAAVLCAPDPQGLSDAQRIAGAAADSETVVPLVIFNGRLASGDAGIGLNVRRMREGFLGRFAPAYSIRPLPQGGSVFFRYPGPWKVFRIHICSPFFFFFFFFFNLALHSFLFGSFRTFWVPCSSPL